MVFRVDAAAPFSGAGTAIWLAFVHNRGCTVEQKGNGIPFAKGEKALD